MVDIQSPTAEIRRGKKIERKKKDRNHVGKSIMACPIPYGGHKYCCVAKRCKVDSRKQHLPSMLAPLYSEESRTHTEK